MAVRAEALPLAIAGRYLSRDRGSSAPSGATAEGTSSQQTTA